MGILSFCISYEYGLCPKGLITHQNIDYEIQAGWELWPLLQLS